ncbi:MAG: HK97 gp10 family phage protein, partial [Candidatus Omnitrophica bacterium]|nr:HK97 gp10 family phage protein [Candidatus Omnitrophota bacterium]
MADTLSVRVDGLKELDRELRGLGEKVARRALRSALNTGAQVIKKDAIARAPFLTGRLAKKSIYVKRTREKGNKFKEVYIIGVRTGRREGQKNRNAFYWFFSEFGTKFMAAKPFLVPAFESKKNEAIEKFKVKLKLN